MNTCEAAKTMEKLLKTGKVMQKKKSHQKDDPTPQKDAAFL